MNIEVETRCKTSRPFAAFTLIELLVVISIMVILAGLIVALAGVTGDKKAISRTRGEIERLVLWIEAYKSKIGIYPPDNPNNAPDRGAGANTSLFYELAGATNADANTYATPFGTVSRAALNEACGVDGIINSANPAGGDVEEDRARVQRFVTEVKPAETNSITVNGQTITVFVVPFKGPDGREINPVFYRSGTNAVHNPGHFDVWAEVKLRKGTKIIGNWKD